MNFVAIFFLILAALVAVGGFFGSYLNMTSKSNEQEILADFVSKFAFRLCGVLATVGILCGFWSYLSS